MRPQAIIGLCVFVFCLIVAIGLPAGGWGRNEPWRVLALAASAVGLIVMLAEPNMASAVWRRRRMIAVAAAVLVVAAGGALVWYRDRDQRLTNEREQRLRWDRMQSDRRTDAWDEAIDEAMRQNRKAPTQPTRTERPDDIDRAIDAVMGPATGGPPSIDINDPKYAIDPSPK